MLSKKYRILSKCVFGFILFIQNFTLLAQTTPVHFKPVRTQGNFRVARINDAEIHYGAGPAIDELEAGDEIGIFDGDLCVGATVITSDLFPVSVAGILRYIAGNDTLPGADPTHEMSFKIWDSSRQSELNAITGGVSGGTFNSDYTVINQLTSDIAKITVNTVPSDIAYTFYLNRGHAIDTLVAGPGSIEFDISLGARLHFWFEKHNLLVSDNHKSYTITTLTSSSPGVSGDTLDYIIPGDGSMLGINIDGSFKIQYELAIDNGEVDDINVPGAGWYDVGASAEVAIISIPYIDPDNNGRRWQFDGWSGDRNDNVTAFNVTMDEPYVVTATWRKEFLLTTTESPDIGGTVIPAPPEHWYNVGSVVDVSAQADEVNNWRWMRWEGSLASETTSTVTVTMDTNKTAIAIFFPERLISVSTDPLGRKFEVDGIEYTTNQTFRWLEGEEHIISILDSSQVDGGNKYNFATWSNGDTRIQTYTVPGNMESLIANFNIQYYVTLIPVYGTATGQGWYDAGSTVDFSIDDEIHSDGVGQRHVFTGWTGYPDATIPSISAPATVTASWKRQFYMGISATPIYAGSTLPAPPGAWYDSGSVQTVIALPATGHQWSSWGGDLAGADNDTTTLLIDAPKSVIADFGGEVSITIGATPAGRSFFVDDVEYNESQVFNWIIGSNHSLLGAYMQNDSEPTRYIYNAWSDGGNRAHQYVVPGTNATVTLNYQTQHKLVLITAHSSASSDSTHGYYKAGDQATFAIYSCLVREGDATQYIFEGWQGSSSNSAYSGPDSSHTIIMNDPVTETASWQKQYYLDVVSEHGVVSGEGWYDEGTTGVDFGVSEQTVSGGTGIQYDFRGWTGNGTISYSGNSLSSTVTMNSPIREEVNWKTQYFLTTTENPAAYGDIAPAPPGAWYDKNTTQSVTALSGTGYQWSSWGGDLASAPNNPTTIMMNEPKSVEANFEIEVSITIQSNPVGRKFSVDGIEYTDTHVFNWIVGREHSLLGAYMQNDGEATRYIFDSWSDEGERAHQYVVPSDYAEVVINYQKQYKLTLVTERGNIISNSLNGYYNHGDAATFAINSLLIQEGNTTRYAFDGWLGSGGTYAYSGTDSSHTIPMNHPVTETVSWQKQYYLDVESEHGTVSGEGWYNEGQSDVAFGINVQTVPGGTGIQYDFRGWTGAGTISYSGTALSGTVTMLNPISEVADWQTQYYLSTSENPDVGGDITPAPPGKWYDKDESADISAVVNSGDTWHGFTGSDNLITMDNPISINMDGPKNVTANFMDFIQVVITSDHIGARFKVREDGEADEVEYTTPHTFSWEEGTTYIISVDAENIIDGSTEHTFVKWDGNESREHEFIVPSTNMAKTFNVTARYLLTINSEYGVPVGAGFQSEGTNAQFSIDAIVTNTEDNSRDSLITWSGDFTGTANPGSIFINGPKEITANWQRQYKLTIETQQEGANPQGSGWYNEGATADFSVTSPIEYSGGTERRQLTGWTGEGNGSYTTGNDLVVISHSVVMNNPIIEHAPYHTRYPLNTTVAPLQAGTITADPTGGWYVAGEDVVVNALAKEGYKWSEWTGDITSNSSTTMVHMDGAKDITANFLDFFQIVITSDHEGIIFEVDDVEYTTPHTFSWEMGAIHSIKVSQVQSIDDNAEYTFVKWDDNEPREHEFIVPSADVTKTFNVTARYLLKINSEKGSPVGAGFYSEDITAQFSVESSITNAQGDMRDNFIGWSGDFTAVTTTGSLAMNGPKEITASWQRQFRLTLVTPHQQANPQGGGWYDEGTKADFSVITPYEYGEDLRNQLIGWVGVGDGSYSTGDDPVVADTSVIMNSGIRQQALWKTQYALNITKSPAVGGIVTTDPSGRWHDFGTDVTITAAANEGYRWHQWTGNISSNASTTIIGINSVRNVTANFEQILAATINTSPSDRKYVVDGSEYSGHNMFGWVEGETHSLSALTPQLDDEDELTRYLFGSWSHGVAQTHNYLVPANAPSLTAYFSKQYRLEVESDHGSPFGEGWDNVGVSRQFGITVSTVEVSSREKFEFQGWTTNSQDGYSGTDLNKILTMNEGIRQIARWDTMYSLIYSVSPSLKGSIAATKNKAWFKRGESVTLTATPIDPETTPYLFTGWTGDTISTEEVLTLDMNKPYTVVANYRLLKHAVTRTALFRDPKGVVHQDSGGVILATPDATEFEHRSKVVFKAQPRTGTKFIEWGGDLSGTDIEQSFNILEDKTFTATFVFDDRQEPYISDNYPLNGASDVPVNTGVQFIVKDDIYGVDLSTLNVSVAGRSIIANGTAISAEVTIRTLKQGYQILYTPVVSFTPSTTVSIAASCRDLADPVNSFSGTYSFSTGASIISEKQESSIPPTGGTLNLPPGVILTIPAGAISDTTQIIVGRVDNAPAVPDSLKKNLLGHTYYFGPDGLQFNLPVTIRIPFDVADLARLGIKSAAALRVYCYTTLVRIWEDVGDIVVDMQNGHVTFTISHFSYFQISATTPEIVPGEIINYPNPFPAPGASTTTIKYMLDHDTEASLKIYDVSSRLVKILVQEGTAVIADTEYNVEWDGRNGQDDDVSNNVYFGVLKTSSGKTYIRKIVLLR